MRPAVAVLFDRLGPYHCARLEATAAHFDTVALETCAESAEYAWDRVATPDSFRRVTLFGAGEGNSRILPSAEIQRRVSTALDAADPTAVYIPGWASTAALSALQWCIERCRPAILMSESGRDDDFRSWPKESIKRQLVGLFSAGLVGGKVHAQYLADLGMPPAAVFTGYDVVDNEYFARGSVKTTAQANELRIKHKLPENYFLASARFVPKKNLDTLIRGYSDYRRKEEETRKSEEIWDLVILGDGPLIGEVKSLVAELGLQNSVRLPGFKQYGELPIYYGLAKAFVHASVVEQWGLVVNEAMASGVPVIVSSRCGCSLELVKEGENGFVFDPLNVGSLSEQLAAMAALAADTRADMGKMSRTIISRFTPAHFGQAATQAYEAALVRVGRRSSWTGRTILKMALAWR